MLGKLSHKKIAILGFGLEGKAIISYLSRHGIKPVLFDEARKQNLTKSDLNFISQHCAGAFFGKNVFNKLTGYEVVFRSPGVLPQNLKALSRKTLLTSQTAEFLKQFSAQTVGVTGTKGKGTTSTLIYEILKADKKSAFLTGNIGGPQAFDILDKIKPHDFIVFELSSFQLREVSKSPHLAVVLMTTSEHLNWHTNLKDYWTSKANITKHQTSKDFAVINTDYPGSKFIGKFGKAKKTFASRYGFLHKGCYVKDGWIWRSHAGRKTKVLKVSEIALIGQHNWENASAAAEASLLLGCKLSSVRKVLKNFKGLIHRLEFVAQKHGVEFYNDSFSTIPDTTIAAIQAFTKPLVLILGGSSKKSDFSDLAKKIAEKSNLKALILMGKEKNRIFNSLKKAGVKKSLIHTVQGNFPHIFNRAKSLAQKGDVVLLSPACASFDMFENYKQRGDIFKSLVKKIHG